MRKTKQAATAILAGALCSMVVGSACAHKAGDLITRFGAAGVSPNDDSSTVKLNGAPIVAGGKAKVDGDTQAGLTLAYMLTDNIGVELLAVTPFRHDITANGKLQSALGVKKLGETKELPPTLSVQYYFSDISPSVIPYVGIGLNYTTFFQSDASHELESKLGNTNLELDDSFGLAGQLGVDVALDDNWMLNAAVWYMDIDTKATFKSPAGKVKTDVDVDPWAYMVGVGYKF